VKITAAILRDRTAGYSIEPVELAEPGPGQVLVRIVGVGMCHTDLVPRGEVSLSPLPIVVGHEGAGVVEALGPDVTTIEVGDHVVLSFASCGECENCTEGHPAYCDTFLFRNLSGRELDGTTGIVDAHGEEVSSRWFGQSSFATHCVAGVRNVVVVDRDLPLEHLGPLGCGVLTGAGSITHALGVPAGRSLTVFGAGAVGLSAVMAAAAVGASPIIAIDLHPARLELARELGATHTIAGDAEDLAAQVLAITGGGAHFAFDTTGVPAVLLTALGTLRMTGVLGMVAVQQGDLVLDQFTPLGKTIKAIFEGDVVPQEVVPQLLDWWREGRFPFDRLIQTFPLDRIDEAEAASLSGLVVKPVLIP
jgi:aryl-alcohol dehydrogenase